MDCENRLPTEPLLPLSAGWHCRSMLGFVMLTAHGRTEGSATPSAGGRAPTKSGCASLPADVARAFQMETGFATSAIALTEAVDEKLELARFLAADGSSAAVLVMDAEVLSRVWPPRGWKTPLVLVRNRLADEGSKFFVVLTTRREASGVIGALASLWERLIARRVQRYSNREGIGFLGSIHVTSQTSITRRVDQVHERVAAVIAHRLAVTTFFCCDAFRIGGGTVNKLSHMRG
ncbi:hypothetical protein ParKJ_22575 [Paraburkholderia fungorum]|uniref:Uncharacterized protein n=1 Tax=Paraburkholderia fungorum TaxID=134537 RepID=A0AAP5QAV2_9BURK|nr:hypothetical protein [Paraburkholderia fungorum]MDT8840213.1 hypothetical protein [Paraburkholderia fungorum]